MLIDMEFMLTNRRFAFIQRFPNIVAVAAVATVISPWLYNNYRLWLSLGRSGLPYNPVGWLFGLFCKPFSRETRSTKIYEKDANKERWLPDSMSIPERRGDRPLIGWHPVPHRQINKIPSSEVKERLMSNFNQHARENPTLVEVAVSPHERMHGAMLIAPSRPTPHKVAKHAWREIAHIHPENDCSLHVMLSPQDCKTVVERGWGERHPLSGTLALPKEYLLIYAPRDDEELRIVELIIVAAIGYMTNSHEVN